MVEVFLVRRDEGGLLTTVESLESIVSTRDREGEGGGRTFLKRISGLEHDPREAVEVDTTG